MPNPVIKEIISAIHVRQVHTPIGVVERFTRDSRVDEVAAHMDRHQHDVTPVFPGEENRGFRGQGGPDGTVHRADLEGLDPAVDIRVAVRPLSGEVLIDSRATLVELLDRFRAAHTFLLVVGSRGFDGIVTPSDMNKQAGRTHLFMLVSALELALAERLRMARRWEDDVLRIIPAKQAGKVRARLRRQQEFDQVADLIATLDFQDLLLVERELGSSELSNFLGIEQIVGLSEFRNRVMHSVLEPAGDSPERLGELLERTELVERVLDALADGQ